MSTMTDRSQCSEQSNDDLTLGSNFSEDQETVTATTSSNSREVGGAAVAGGLAGLLVAGPVGGLVAAGGGAAVASKNKGKAGNVARKTGEKLASAGDRLKTFSKKHLPEKASKGIASAGNHLKTFDEKHQVTKRTSQVTKKTSESLVKSYNFMADKFKPCNGKMAETPQ